VILAFLYGQTRIFFVMSRDGLLPEGLGRVNAKTGTPITVTLITAVIVAAIAAFFPLSEIAELANAGTLAAFVAVALCMLTLRVRDPSRPRAFRTPAPWVVGPVAVAGCIYLVISLPEPTRDRFFIWNAIGIVVYFLYGMRKSRLAAQPSAGD
jgi:APA family basic amino acid/polyamine antiporter